MRSVPGFVKRRPLGVAGLLVLALAGCGSSGNSSDGGRDGGGHDGGGHDVGGGSGHDAGPDGAAGSDGAAGNAGSDGGDAAAGNDGAAGHDAGADGAAGTADGAAGTTDGAAANDGAAGGDGAAGSGGGAGHDAGAGNDGAAGATDGATDGPPSGAAPSNLAAAVLDRRNTSFQLTWTAPTGAGVTGYEVRYAKVAITATNFDDASVTTAVPYTGTPAAPGAADGLVVKGLYIENGYFFAVAAVSGGARGAIASTSAAVTAHFNATVLTGTSGLANEEAGFGLDGSGDANGDKLSDVLVGTFNAGRAYIFFGATGFAPTAPSVTISSTTSSFGRAVAFIGDIDDDGFEDFAVGDPVRNEVFIFKGRMAWPSTLADTDATYTITTDASYTNATFGGGFSRLGDFNGDGFDDFVIQAANFGGTAFTGRVVIVLGGPGFTGFALPSATRSIVIDGDATLTRPFFGTRALGLGHFYGAGTTLIVSAPGINGVASNNEGHIYAFRGQSGTNGVINVSAADAVVAGAAAGDRIGTFLANLGPILGVSPSVGSGNSNDAMTVPGTSGTAFVFSGDTLTGPFATKRTFFTTSGVTNEATAVLGGGLPGLDRGISLIGSGTPDLVLVARTGSPILIVDGAKIPALPNPADASTADVHVATPATWGLTAPTATLLPDVNGDGTPDFAISDASGTVVGHVAVYW